MTLAWISRNRRLARDFERYATTVAAFIRLAMIRIMLRRHLLPTLDGGEDAFGVGGPDEGFGIGVGLGHEAVDGELQVDDGLEDAALETLACELGEETFNGVKPGRRGRGEVEGPARVTGQPSAHPRVFVGGIVVDDGMDHFSHRNLRLDRIEEANELLMAVTLHVAADDSAVEDVESREQRGGAVAFVVVRHRPSAARLHRQPRLGAVERLDLAL